VTTVNIQKHHLIGTGYAESRIVAAAQVFAKDERKATRAAVKHAVAVLDPAFQRPKRSDVEALVRHVRKTAGSDAAKAREWLKQAVRSIDRAVSSGVMKKNTAARTKSRLSKLIAAAAKR